MFYSMSRLALSLVLLLSFSSFASAQVLYEYNGKTYQLKDLPTRQQQSIYEVEDGRYKTIASLIDNIILNDYVSETAKKQSKTEEAVLQDLFKIKQPTDKELKSYYDSQKDHIPYPFEQIKDRLKEHVLNEKRFAERTKFVNDLKNKGKFKYHVAKPQPPKFEIDTKGFATKSSGKAPKLTVVEFADYQCPHCRQFHGMMQQVLKKMGKDINFVFVDFPVNPSGVSTEAAKIAYCIRLKDEKKFWDYHDKVFANQEKLTKTSVIDYAKELKVFNKELENCIVSPAAQAFITKSKSLGEQVGVTGTPTVFINGEKAIVSHSADEFLEQLKAKL